MYKATARWLIRRNIARLNQGDLRPTLAMFAPDAVLSFPGVSSWSRQFREPTSGLEPSASHQGRDEIEAFLARYVAAGIQMQVDDILVNGPPWNMRAAARVRDWIPLPDGTHLYENRAVLFVRVVWGRIRTQEDYEDTQRAAAIDVDAPDLLTAFDREAARSRAVSA
jgi:ketosteroid isomerase-like protein